MYIVFVFYIQSINNSGAQNIYRIKLMEALNFYLYLGTIRDTFSWKIDFSYDHNFPYKN